MTENSRVVLLDFQARLEAASDGIAVVDERGRILVVNDQLCNLFGYQPAELVGEPVETLVTGRPRRVHNSHRSSYQGHPTTRSMGMGLDRTGPQKAGE